ncbi:phosphoenolpyruvate carboxylase kinase 1-like [Iris pallida]|uniref:Phosphoenolpyruvate carboxylase kinase 1-like n=1 Tax=Iris pallida TaxID=29817 RepID=A0AAX6FP35_IRIPA|nr:phosphoenolpyruvate carboxylase kinase 1-like [Iris pallida]KAJ6817785.1 phosphoenolpyruvate carboxylase kinase 1-like [Iris pallida]
MTEALHRDYQIGEEIGSGRFGIVYRCTSSSSGEQFAVKSINKALLVDPVDRDCIDTEAKLTHLASSSSSSHSGSHTVRLHGVYEDSSFLHLVLDLCDGSDLFDHLSRHAPLPEPEAASIMTSVIEAISSCHKNGVAHRDIKPDNILFDGQGGLRLADFGSAGWFGGGGNSTTMMSGLVGTAHYVAPEVVRGEEYGEKVDIWSAGVVLYVMLGGGLPFEGGSAVEVFEAVMRGNLRFPTRIFGWVSPEAKDLMRRMMSKDVSRRLSAEQALRHPWITSGGGAR